CFTKYTMMKASSARKPAAKTNAIKLYKMDAKLKLILFLLFSGRWLDRQRLDGIRNGLGRQAVFERDQLVILHRFPVLRQLQLARDEPCGFKSLQMQIEERPTQPHLPRKLAYISAPFLQSGDDPHPVRIRQR